MKHVIAEATRQYDHTLVNQDNHWVFQSVCLRCGFKILGTPAGTLRRDEADHTEKCSRADASPVAVEAAAPAF